MQTLLPTPNIFISGLRTLVLDHNTSLKAAGLQEICNALLDDTWLVGGWSHAGTLAIGDRSLAPLPTLLLPALSTFRTVARRVSA